MIKSNCGTSRIEICSTKNFKTNCILYWSNSEVINLCINKPTCKGNSNRITYDNYYCDQDRIIDAIRDYNL